MKYINLRKKHDDCTYKFFIEHISHIVYGDILFYVHILGREFPYSFDYSEENKDWLEGMNTFHNA